ncbi:MAG: glycoside hydrolase family 78 protein [Tannerella sp.]|jgi:alpha-L-rhamnosidase|nr:glycoside hydrolase family 78 protein [Tannerella sp.]
MNSYKHICFVYFIAFLLLMQLSSCSNPPIEVRNLTCEYLENPLGIDVGQPRFSWQIKDRKGINGQRQTAYRLLVASSLDKLKQNEGDLWDSQKTESEETHLVEYQGIPLHSGNDCYWKVQSFDRDGNPSAWSKPARFSVGLLDSSDWKGSWVKHPTAHFKQHIWFRKNFDLKTTTDLTAFAYLASTGFHELYVNGRKADERVLAPAVSRIDKRVLYVTYDIAPLLKKGKNTIAVWFGPGWSINNFFTRRVDQALIAQINIENPKGDNISFATDSAWKCAESFSAHSGDFRFMDMGGELVDGTHFTEDWNKTDFDDSGWENAIVTEPNKRGGAVMLSACMTDPSRIIKTIKAKSVTDTVPGVYRVDMGEQFTGFLRARFDGLKRGDTVVITVSEKTYAIFNGEDMKPSGRIGNETIEDQRQKMFYIARGEKGETFSNRFNVFCGRYIHFAGLPAMPKSADITGYAVSSAPHRTGSFECSDPMWNKIFEADLHTYEMCHNEGVIVDCPNRERLGYGPEGAYQTTWGAGLPFFASGAYYVKNVRDWKDVQHDDGSVNNVAPQISVMYGCALNGSAAMNIAMEHYQKYGDKRILIDVQPMAKRWLDFLHSWVKDGMLTPYGSRGYFLGDWVSPGPTFEYAETDSALFFNNCVYAMSLDWYINLVRNSGLDPQTAETDIPLYQSRLDTLRRRLHETYYRPDLDSYLNGDQVRTVCALYAGIVPDSLRERVLAHLATDLSEIHPFINIGSFGRYPFYKTLIADDRFYEIFSNILSKTTYPSYGYFIENNCNVFPETWEIAHSNCAQTHTSYAGISAWFVKGLAGIEPAEAGYKTVNIRPHVIERLTFARVSTETPYGQIVSGWKKASDATDYEISVPVGCTANVYLENEEVKRLEAGEYRFCKINPYL